MILWINGAFGAGKTTVANELVAQLPHARLCDPERIGFVIRRTFWRDGDYQDVELWRQLVRRRVARVGRHGIAVVPMTVVCPDVFHEVTPTARVFLLTASRSTLEHRIAGSSVASEWRRSNLDRCLAAFDDYDLGEPIETDRCTPKQIAQEITDRVSVRRPQAIRNTSSDASPNRRSGGADGNRISGRRGGSRRADRYRDPGDGEVEMVRRAAAMLVAVLALVGCGDSKDVNAGDEGVSGGDADEVVAAAITAVLGDGPFRSHSTGQVPFAGGLTGTYEQSGGDVVDVSESGSYATATILMGDTAYEWDSTGQSWMETPLDSYDPLMGPGMGLVIGLATAFDTSDVSTTSDELPGVATGWTEVESLTDGTRRFERTLPPRTFTGTEGWADDAPVERLEESAVTAVFYDDAVLTAIVELDAEGELARYVVRSEFDGAHDFPDCGPLNNAVGSVEQVTEFTDVGTEFEISVPTPAEMVARFPALAEQPDFSIDDSMDVMQDEFMNAAGERDLTGCPTP